MHTDDAAEVVITLIALAFVVAGALFAWGWAVALFAFGCGVTFVHAARAVCTALLASGLIARPRV